MSRIPGVLCCVWFAFRLRLCLCLCLGLGLEPAPSAPARAPPVAALDLLDLALVLVPTSAGAGAGADSQLWLALVPTPDRPVDTDTRTLDEAGCAAAGDVCAVARSAVNVGDDDDGSATRRAELGRTRARLRPALALNMRSISSQQASSAAEVSVRTCGARPGLVIGGGLRQTRRRVCPAVTGKKALRTRDKVELINPWPRAALY